MTFNGKYHPEPTWWNDLIHYLDETLGAVEVRFSRLFHWRD